MRGYMRVVTVIILPAAALLSLAVLYFNAEAEDDCLRVKIWTDRTEYIPHEPILIKYELHNARNDNMLTNFWYLKEHFRIIDDKDRGYNNTMWGEYILGDTLHASEIVTDSEYVQSRYQTYNIAIYECSMVIPGEVVVPGCPYTMKSNSITFSVKEPEGENRQALALYLRADSLGRMTELEKSVRRRNEFEAYLDAAAKYPNTIYAPMALYMALLMESVPQDKTELISIGKRLIEDYPNTPYGAWACPYLVKAYRQTAGIEAAVEYFEYLRGKYPDSVIARRAEYWLGKIKEGKA